MKKQLMATVMWSLVIGAGIAAGIWLGSLGADVPADAGLLRWTFLIAGGAAFVVRGLIGIVRVVSPAPAPKPKAAAPAPTPASLPPRPEPEPDEVVPVERPLRKAPARKAAATKKPAAKKTAATKKPAARKPPQKRSR
jgi:hypothetical protein